MVTRKKTTERPELDEVKGVKVTRVYTFSNGAIAFDAVFANAFTVYNMIYREGEKDGEAYSMISFPSRKGTDGKYYSHVYFKITDDMKQEIEKQISDLL